MEWLWDVTLYLLRREQEGEAREFARTEVDLT